MDGFDDLLSSSSRALEDNPFADPFAKPRSISPDPWATFGQQQEDDTFRDESLTTQFGTSHGAEGGQDLKTDSGLQERARRARATGDVHAAESDSETAPTTPEQTKFDFHGPQSPGFRESISTDDTSRDTALPNNLAGKCAASVVQSTTSPPSPQKPLVRTPPPELESQHPGSPISTASPPLPSPLLQSEHFVSPLDSSSPRFTQSFASLAIGGESVGGWQDYQASFTSSVVPPGSSSSESTEEAPQSLSKLPPLEGEEDQPPPAVGKPDTSQTRFLVTVDDPQKVGDPIRPYVLYTVHTKTASSLFVKSSFSVLRRYSDFLWLYETLAMNNPGVFVPPVPEKSSFGRFDNQFIQQRRSALEKCVQKIANHPVLAKDPDLRMFLESDSFALDIKHRKTEIAQERGGLMSTIGQTIAGPRFYEVDDWFDQKKVYLDSLEAQLKGLVKAVEMAAKQRAELATATGEFAHAIGELSGSELSKQLSHSLAVMSDVEKRAQDLQHTQAQEDAVTFMNTAEEYTRIINAVRLAFTSRVRCHAQWQSVEGELRRVKQVHEKARSQGRISQDRIGHSLAQIADAERKALDAKQEFEQCGRLIKTEMARFEDERVRDFKESMELFLEGMIQRQKELISSWESYQELLLKKVNAVQRPLGSDSQSALLST